MHMLCCYFWELLATDQGDLGAAMNHDAVPQNPGTGLPKALEAGQQSQQGNPPWLVSWMLH